MTRPLSASSEELRKVEDGAKKLVHNGRGAGSANVEPLRAESGVVTRGEPDFSAGGVWGRPETRIPIRRG